MKENTLTKRDIVVIAILIIGSLFYFLLSPKILLDPAIESQRMDRLDEIKNTTSLSVFETDGCSGNISKIWDNTIESISKISPVFKEKYSGTKVPFENACIKHDRLYHKGIGGYVGRLKVDNILRTDIISYGIENSHSIMISSGIKTEEEVIFIYELIADAIYTGVRTGGSPCTDRSYAWGFGYNNGVCN